MATPVLMPRQGQTVESCVLVEWLVKVGDKVEAGQALANIETDKAVFELESPAAGTMLALFFDAGADIPVLTHIAAIGNPGEDASALKPSGAPAAPKAEGAAPAAAEAAPASQAAAPAAAAGAAPAGPAVGVSPRARKLAEAAGVDAAALPGTGPGGRVIERDVKAAAAAGPRLSPAAREAAAGAGVKPPASGTGPGGMVLSADLKAAPAAAPAAVAAIPAAEPTVTPITGIRKLIAERMHKSLATTAQLTMTMSFDATAILAYRQKLKAKAEAMGLPNITINDMIAYATARTLVKHPDLNAHCLGDRVARFPQVNLGVATDTPRGLMVPVLRSASRLSLVEMSKQIKPMLEAAQKGNINPDLLSGGSFTITNMGMLGVESFTPILNAPEVAILGVGGLTLRPVASGDGVKHVQSITLSLTVDHRVVDGAPGARFLKALCAALEDFELTLAG